MQTPLVSNQRVGVDSALVGGEIISGDISIAESAGADPGPACIERGGIEPERRTKIRECGVFPTGHCIPRPTDHAREARSSLLLKRNAVRGGHLPDSSGALCVCLPIRQMLHYQGNVGVEPGHAAEKGVVIQVPGTGRNLFHRHD